jgi:hypothetical protein
MLRWITLASLFYSAVTLTCCVTGDEMLVTGRVNDVSIADLDAGVAANVREFSGPAVTKPRKIEVVSRNEIRIYWTKEDVLYGDCTIVKRINGKWQVVGRVLVTS